MLVVGFPTGAFQANCYLVAPGEGEACVIIDPGQDAVEPIEEALRKYRLSPVAALLTHGHFDHVFSVTPICDGNDIPAFIHPDDRHMLNDPMKGISEQAMQFFGGRLELREPSDVRELDDTLEFELAGLSLTVDHTPGHTQGSVVFHTVLDEGGRVMFAGDTLFAGSIGRTDLPGGDMRTMTETLRTKILPLPDETVVLPGHGNSTTIGRERAGNPFLLELDPGATGPTRGM